MGIPLAIAAWCRYLMGTDDNVESFEISVDPQKEFLISVLNNSKGSDGVPCIREILSKETIFGIDLYEAGLGEKITEMFISMNEGPGAVRKTIEEYLG